MISFLFFLVSFYFLSHFWSRHIDNVLHMQRCIFRVPQWVEHDIGSSSHVSKPIIRHIRRTSLTSERRKEDRKELRSQYKCLLRNIDLYILLTFQESAHLIWMLLVAQSFREEKTNKNTKSSLKARPTTKPKWRNEMTRWSGSWRERHAHTQMESWSIRVRAYLKHISSSPINATRNRDFSIFIYLFYGVRWHTRELLFSTKYNKNPIWNKSVRERAKQMPLPHLDSRRHWAMHLSYTVAPLHSPNERQAAISLRNI